MKTINIHFEDSEHKKYSEIKGSKSWKDFFIEAVDEINKKD